jgi:acyl dehydratase
MPLQSRVVGEPLPSVEMLVTPRMALAYSAGINESGDAAFDDTRANFAASPFFCVTPEWQFVIAVRNKNIGVTPDEAIRAVHAGQFTQFHAPLIAGHRVRVSGSIAAIRQTRAGALSTTRMDITDLDTNTLISSTRSDGMYRDVAVEGGDRIAEPAPEGPPTRTDLSNVAEVTIPLDRWFAHRYTECANIWNPIHTEQRVALAANLPGTIVHGTALWALAGKTIADAHLGSNAHRLKALSGRFSAMVPAATPIRVRHAKVAENPDYVAFSVLNDAGAEAVSAGFARIA